MRAKVWAPDTATFNILIKHSGSDRKKAEGYLTQIKQCEYLL